MAEARSEEEEENMMRDAREQVVRRQSNNSGGRSDRRKPEHRHSQGPLSSIRAAIKRTSTRPTSLSESSRDRERDRDRDRRRPEITILSAEPLSSTSWFPGASGGLPPPPPPAAQIWGPTIPPSIQPPPSYEEVIREKTQEQVLLPSSSSSSTHPASTITIATQTDPESDLSDSQVKRPLRPARPPHPSTKSSPADDISATNKPVLPCPGSANTCLPSQSCDHLTDLPAPLTSNAGAQTVPWDQSFPPEDVSGTPAVPLQRPRARPRSKVDLQPIKREVKVQTLVKLREDGLATIAARATADSKPEVSQGKYLTELLEAFSADDWGFPDRYSDSSGHSQSDSEEDEEEDMATLKARIQAFEQRPVADGSCEDVNNADFVSKKGPEPRPRPRLQGQPAKSVPPAVAPKPKNFLNAPSNQPYNKMFWEDGAAVAAESSRSADLKTAKTQAADQPPPSSPPKSGSALVAPKSATETLLFSQSVPIPAPRPSPPKHGTSVSETPSLTPIPPPRPVVSPRASLGSANLEKKLSVGLIIPALPPRSSDGTLAETRNEETKDPAHQTVKTGSGRPSLPNKPTAVTTTPRASAPNLTPKSTRVSTDQSLGPVKPPGLVPRQKPPSPALRKASDSQTKPEPANASNPSDPPLPPRPASMKILPLRPPPIKSNPGRPPPPSVGSSLANLTTTPPPKTIPAASVSSSNQSPSLQTTASVSTNQIPPRTSKKGPPLPPRPKPGHPLYNSYMKQEVLIVLDDPSPSEDVSGDRRSQTTITPLINQSQCLLDLDIQPKSAVDEDSQSKAALEGLNQSILPESPAELKEKPEPPPLSGPRCVALFDYEGEKDDELTFSQGDVIALQELVGQEWGRGQIHGRVGIFPLNFTQVVEPLPQSSPTAGQVPGPTEVIASLEPNSQEWDMALFDFPGQTADDLSFHKGAIIQVTEHIDAEWRRGRLEGREGLYPAAFTQPHQAQQISVQQPAVKGVAKFDFTAESDDELTLKVGDIITEVESVDEEWITGVADGKRGIVPKSYISVF